MNEPSRRLACWRLGARPAAYLLMIAWTTIQPAAGFGDEAGTSTASSEQAGRVQNTAPPSKVVSLADPNLDESSGLAVSRHKPDRFWTHNDSGGEARLLAFADSGIKTGECLLAGSDATDWEDIASFADGGVARLLVADCGDNQAVRPSVQLHLLDEPDPDASVSVSDYQTFEVQYSDGPRDCEAVAVDVQRRQIVLITKSKLPLAGIYVLDLPSRGAANSNGTQRTKSDLRAAQRPTAHGQVLVAKRVGVLALPMITAMDIEQGTGDAVVVTYLGGFRFRRSDASASVREQFLAVPDAVELPRWKQIEAVAIDPLGHVWVTSEGSPAPLTRLNR